MARKLKLLILQRLALSRNPAFLTIFNPQLPTLYPNRFCVRVCTSRAERPGRSGLGGKMKYVRNKFFIIGTLLLCIVALAAFKFESKKAPQYFTEKVQKGDIQNAVQATGAINAVTTVQVGSQVSGTIQTLFADFNSHVKKDQVVAQIDPSLFQGALLQAKADLANAQANVVAAKANLAKAQAAAVQSKLDYDRYTALAADGVVPAQQLDAAKATWQTNDAVVGAAKAQVTQAAAQA